MPRRSFSVHSDFYAEIKNLDKSEQGELFSGLVYWSETGEVPELSKCVSILFRLMTAQIERISVANSDNGAKKAKPLKKSEKSEAPKKKPTVTNTVSDTVSVSDNSSCPQSSISDAEGKPEKVFAHDTDAYKAARYLDKRICENVPSKQPADEKTLQRWAGDIDKINRIDGQSWDDISDVLEFCQNDFFWRTNILSGKKLREKFIQLLAKARNTS